VDESGVFPSRHNHHHGSPTSHISQKKNRPQFWDTVSPHHNQSNGKAVLLNFCRYKNSRIRKPFAPCINRGVWRWVRTKLSSTEVRLNYRGWVTFTKLQNTARFLKPHCQSCFCDYSATNFIIMNEQGCTANMKYFLYVLLTWYTKLWFFFFPVCAITASGVPGGTLVSMNRFSTLCGWLARQGWRVKGRIWPSEQPRSAKANSWLDYQMGDRKQQFCLFIPVGLQEFFYML
jgi:hypothetical protein